jgi:hypothetical protein
VKDAKAAVAALKRALGQLEGEIDSKKDRQASQKRLREMQDESRRSVATLESLSQRLNCLAQKIGSQDAGYEFQTWFYDVMDFFEIVNRRPYIASGRQIDGSVTISGTTYLVELKFTREQVGATDIDSILAKIADKADNTMGIMLSMSGYSTVALEGASGRRTPLLLMDHRHVYFALSGAMPFGEMIERIRRHASQTGEAFLPPDKFGG